MEALRQARETRLEETKRIARVLRIMQLIGSQPRRWSRKRLAGYLEMSPRMIDKDLELIRHGLCFDLRHGEGGYYFAGSPAIAPPGFSVPEILALALAAQQARDTGSVDPATIGAALTRLEEALPAPIVPYLRRAGASRNPLQQPVHERWPVLATLEQAMAERRKAAIQYVSASRHQAVSERTIAPYHLMPYERSWQVIALDSRRGDVRMFKLDRIRTAELTDESYAIPADFDLEAYLGDQWGVLRGEAERPERVVLRFSERAAPWVMDDRLHASQQIEELPDGGVLLTYYAGVTHELVRWVLSFGGDVVVAEPEGLREAVVKEAQAVVQRGQEGQPLAPTNGRAAPR
jgi:predicted DNA-binding transcriptional regulator YafY